MIWKRKRKEKPKNKNKMLRNIIILLILLLLLGLGLLAAVTDMPVSSTLIFDNGQATAQPCAFVSGTGDRLNTEATERLKEAVGTAGIAYDNLEITDDLREYEVCGDESRPLYHTCTLLELSLPIEESDPSRGELGTQIGALLAVLQDQATCIPENLHITFVTPNGSIGWSMTTYYAMQAFEDGARGADLYNIQAR